MKNKLLRKLSALTITLLVALALTACAPEIHVHTGDSSSEKDLLISTEETASQDGATSDVDTSVASSDKQEPDSPQDSTASQSISSKTEKPNSDSSGTISISKAKSIALKDAGVKESEIYDYEIELDRDTGVLHYDISFEKDGKDYEYDIDAATGKIINVEKPQASSGNTTSKSSQSGTISKSKAKNIALKDAGVKESEIYDYEIELDRDTGVLHYDISFEKDGNDYDYEINAATGKIISVEKPNATSSTVKISKSKAKNTALKHAGVKSADISRYQIELEKDNGVWKYEVSFNVGNVEYEYTINAETGKIIKSEKDIDD